MIRVSFQGEHGAYSESAAYQYFNKEINAIPLRTFSDVIYYTNVEKSDYSILPIENSLEGTIGENYDLLYSTTLVATGEVYYKIEHCLIGLDSFDRIDTVYSHPQALGQCRKFINKYNLKSMPTYDTAGSIKIIKKLNKKNIGCIASKRASKIFEMPIIKLGMGDNSNNYTRFLILSKTKSYKTKNDKTSIIFSIKHKQGELYNIIKKFYNKKINLTKIESRPKRNTIWEYNFYIDFEGHIDTPIIHEVMDDVKGSSVFFKIIGSYHAAGRR